MSNININLELMDSIATSSRRLVGQLEEVRSGLENVARDASSMSGQTVEAFCSFIYERAIGVINETSDMCEQIAISVTQTRNQFSETDSAGASIYRG